MTHQPLSTSIATRLFLAPDGDASTLGGGIADVIPPASNTIPSVTEVILGDQPAIEASSAVAAAREPQKDLKTLGPQDLGMESAEESSERAGLTKKRDRDTTTGKFIKAKGEEEPGAPTPQKPVAKAPATPAKPTAPAQPAKPVAAKPAPQVPAKVKIGAEEKTSEEWAKEFAELRAQAAKPPEPKAEAAPVETPEQLAAAAEATKQREEKFITEKMKDYLLDHADGGAYDQLLAGGEKGAQAMARLLTTVLMHSRQFTAAKVSELQSHYDETTGPLISDRQTIQQLMAENAFLATQPEIKDNPKGLETFRAISKQMDDGYKAIQDKITAGTATKSEQGWALQYEDMTPEALKADIALLTKAKLAEQPAATTAIPAKPQVPKPAPELKVVERPLSADRPGAASPSRGETKEQQLARELNQKYA